MSERGFDRSDLQRVMQSKGIEIGAEEKKEQPKSTGIQVRNILLTVVACVYFVFLFFGKYFIPADNHILLSMDVFSGVENPNRLIRIVSLAILTLSVSAVLRFFIGRMAGNSSITKRTGRAMIELFANFVKYVAFIVLIFLILSALGVNTTELLAGLGILSLILGLGVTSLIEDVVAGIFIIAERLYDVGDIVVPADVVEHVDIVPPAGEHDEPELPTEARTEPLTEAPTELPTEVPAEAPTEGGDRGFHRSICGNADEGAHADADGSTDGSTDRGTCMDMEPGWEHCDSHRRY